MSTPIVDSALSSRPLHRGSGCHECRRRKLKCSGTKPSCDRCVRSGTSCVYDPVEKSKVALLRDELLMLRDKVRSLETFYGIEAPADSLLERVAAREAAKKAAQGVVSVPAKRRSPEGGLAERVRQAPPSPGSSSWRVALSVDDQAKLLSHFIDIQHVANEYTGVAPNPHPPTEPYAAKTAAFLLASHFSPSHEHLRLNLLECTRHCIDEAIRSADHPGTSYVRTSLVLDAIHASSLLAAWMLMQGRLVECQQALFSAAKLAILSGLHKIRSVVDCSPSSYGPSVGNSPSPGLSPGRERPGSSHERPGSSYERPTSSGGRSIDERSATDDSERPKTMIPRAVDLADVRNRVGIFWQLLCLDYTAAILMGSSVNVSLPWEDCLSEVRVETLWPDFEDASIASLFHPVRVRAPPVSRSGSDDCVTRSPGSPLSAFAADPQALRAKSVVLLERAVRLSAQSERGSCPTSPAAGSTRHKSPAQTLRAAIKETDSAISNVLEQLPVSRPTLQLRAAYLHPHTLMLCARVRLHETIATQDRISQVIWVQSAVAIVRLLDGMEESEVVRGADLLLAYSWIASYMVLLNEHYYVPYHPESEHAQRIRTDLDKLKSLLEAVGARMPVIDTMFKSAVDQFHARRVPASPTTDHKSSEPDHATTSQESRMDDEHDELEDDN